MTFPPLVAPNLNRLVHALSCGGCRERLAELKATAHEG